jgi:hypothetical protein
MPRHSMRSKLKLPKATTADHVYVYAAVEGSPTALLPAGMPGGAPPQAVALSDDIVLIASHVPAATYNTETIEARLSDLDWVAEAGAAHHAVIDAIADSGLVTLPFRLFTIFSNERRAGEVFTERLPDIRRAFDRVRGRSEWVLRIGKPDPARATRPAPAAAATSGTSFLAAKAAARRDDAARAARVQREAAAAYEALARVAEDTRLKAVDAGGNVLLDAALLVSPEAVDDLKRTLTASAAQLLEDGCAVSLTGPWPPYSFASLEHAAND